MWWEMGEGRVGDGRHWVGDGIRYPLSTPQLLPWGVESWTYRPVQRYMYILYYLVDYEGKFKFIYSLGLTEANVPLV